MHTLSCEHISGMAGFVQKQLFVQWADHQRAIFVLILSHR